MMAVLTFSTKGRGQYDPTLRCYLLERMLEDREDFIWLRLARGQDPFPTKQGDCGCGPSSDVLTPSGDATTTTTNLTGPIVPVAAEIN